MEKKSRGIAVVQQYMMLLTWDMPGTVVPNFDVITLYTVSKELNRKMCVDCSESNASISMDTPTDTKSTLTLVEQILSCKRVFQHSHHHEFCIFASDEQ